MFMTLEFGDGFILERVKIKTTIATKEEQVDEAIKALMSNSWNHKRLIGLDMIPIRTTPGSSTSGKPSSATLQLGDSRNCLIVRLHSFHAVPESLYNFLILPNFTFAGFGIKETMVRLEKDYGLVCKNVFEVGPAMWWPSEYNNQIFREAMKAMRMPPTSSISDPWGSSLELTKDEITIAVSNAVFSYLIAQNMIFY